MALSSGDFEKFNESAATATADARKQFMDAGGEEKLRTAFGAGARRIAMHSTTLNSEIYPQLRKSQITRAGLETIRRSNRALLKKMTIEERTKYVNGKMLAEGKSVEGLTAEQKTQAQSTYESIHQSLQGAGDSWEIAKWEDQIAIKGGSLVTALASHRGTFYDDSTHLVLKDIENMSESDWNALKTDKSYRQGLDTVLKDYLSDGEYVRAKKLLDEKKLPPQHMSKPREAATETFDNNQ